MLVYLDNGENVKTHPNENFGRELLELFTMGVGHYTEHDVREAARAFTGWTNDVLTFKFDAEQHDFGQKTFLGDGRLQRRGHHRGDPRSAGHRASSWRRRSIAFFVREEVCRAGEDAISAARFATADIS